MVGRNYHTRWGEVDIIAVRMAQETGSETVHFVEVKTRTGLAYGTPGTAVTYVKQQKIKTTALHWLQNRGVYYPQLSFDVIEIWVLGETAKIRWLPHCF